MFIGHIPAGYVAARLLYPHLAETGVDARRFLGAGVLGAIAPDLDLIYLHLIDHGQRHHHTYATHFPIVWLALVLATMLWVRYAWKRRWAALAVIFALGGFGHMLLDSIVGDIWWLAPFVDRPFALFTVPALYQPWWLNFILHWTFAFEIVLVVWAACLWRSPIQPLQPTAKTPGIQRQEEEQQRTVARPPDQRWSRANRDA